MRASSSSPEDSKAETSLTIVMLAKGERYVTALQAVRMGRDKAGRAPPCSAREVVLSGLILTERFALRMLMRVAPRACVTAQK